MKTLVWTRSRDDWAADSPLLAQLPGEPTILHLPCVRLVPRAAQPSRDHYDHIVLTSSHAVAFALTDARLAGLLRTAKSLHTHGKATAARLRAGGLTAEHADVRTAAELGEALVERLPDGASILVPTAAEPAFDLAGWLRGNGYAAEAVACYETEARAREADGRELTPERRRELQRTLRGAVCFASPSAVTGFAAELLQGDDALRTALVAVAIGPTTAEAAKEAFARVETAAENSLAALAQGGAMHTA